MGSLKKINETGKPVAKDKAMTNCLQSLNLPSTRGIPEVAHLVKNLLHYRRPEVQSLGRGDPWRWEMPTHSSILDRECHRQWSQVG